jgi:CubicO group peptidase (beta-lactamase class C family)
MHLSTERLGAAVIVFAAALLGHSPCVAEAVNTAPKLAAPLTSSEVASFLDQFIPAQLARSEIPGAVVVVIKDDQVLAEKGYGFADVESHRPMTSDRTLTNIASIKKLFEGIAIMQLVERGCLNLDEDVNSYLDFSIPTPRGGVPVTLRRLMTHRGGFEDWFKTTHATMAEQLPPRLFPDADVPAYSNYGASLMTYILERASGQSARNYVTEHVLAPLGMKSSSFDRGTPASRPLGPADARALMAIGYQIRQGSPPVPLSVVSTDLQLNATGNDMGRFMRALLSGGVLDGQRILLPETLATMMAPQVTEPLSVMGLNFYQREVAGVAFLGHRGDTSTFQDDMVLLPALNIGIYVSYTAQADDSQRDELEQAFVTRFLKVPAPEGTTFVARAADASNVAGWYEHTRRSETNLFSVEELFTQRRIKVDGEGSILSRTAGYFAKPQRWVKRTEIAPYIFASEAGEKWAFAHKSRGLTVLETSDGTSGRVRVPWYRTAEFVQAVMTASLLIMSLGVLVWPLAALVGVKLWPASRPRIGPYAFVHGALLLHLAAAAAVIFLVFADWGQWQIFVDDLDPWLVALYVDAWLAVLVTPIVLWVAYRTWRQGSASWFEVSYFSITAAAMTASAWFAVVWHVAGTTLKY